MNKQLSIIVILIFFSLNGLSQTVFGVKGGVNINFYNQNEGDFGENPEADLGFYAGFFTEFDFVNSLHLQPELLYIGLNDFQFLNAPIYLKYDISNSFNIMVGPSFNYFFDFFSNKFKVRADLSLAYNLSSNIDMHMKYTLGFEELSPNVLFLGVGYRL